MAVSQANGKFCLKVCLIYTTPFLTTFVSTLGGSNLCSTHLASEHINLLEKSLQQSKEAQQQLANASAQMDAVRQEMETLRNENHHLYQEMQHYREQARPATATAMHPQPAYVPPPPTGAPMMIDQNRSLPPLTPGLVAGANSMQGVQYSEDRR